MLGYLINVKVLHKFGLRRNKLMQSHETSGNLLCNWVYSLSPCVQSETELRCKNPGKSDKYPLQGSTKPKASVMHYYLVKRHVFEQESTNYELSKKVRL